MRLLPTWIIPTVLVTLVTWAGAAAGAPFKGKHIEVELISEVSRVVPGNAFWVALKLSPDPEWHTYWRNPGDSGLPTRIEWTLPEGGTVSRMLWPYPERIPLSAHAVNYGYHDQVLLMTRIQPPAALGGDQFQVHAVANWLVCKHVCIPGKARLELSLPVSDQPELDSRWHGMFEQTRKRLPRDQPGWQAGFTIADGTFQLDLKTQKSFFDHAEPIAYVPLAEDIVQNAAPQHFRTIEGGLLLRQTKSEYFTRPPQELMGLLLVHNNGRREAYRFTAIPGTDRVDP